MVVPQEEELQLLFPRGCWYGLEVGESRAAPVTAERGGEEILQTGKRGPSVTETQSAAGGGVSGGGGVRVSLCVCACVHARMHVCVSVCGGAHSCLGVPGPAEGVGAPRGWHGVQER